MSGRASKVKGSGFEREIVLILREAGVEADRVPLSGAVMAFPGDVKLNLRGERVTAECKRRKSGFKTHYRWLGNNKVLFLRDDHCEALVLMRAKDFAKLVGAA